MAIAFRTIVGVIALVVFVVLMVLLYQAAKARGKNVKFPPDVPACPDFFVESSSGANTGGCLLPPGLGNRNIILDLIRKKNPSLAEQLGAGKPLQIPSGSLCAFTRDNGINWNGVSNVHPCISN